MGNAQKKEIDLLELYMDSQEQNFSYNSSLCDDIFTNINGNSSNINGNFNSIHDSISNIYANFSSEESMDISQQLNTSDLYSRCYNSTIPSNIFNQPYILPWYQQLLWTLLFAVMIMVAILGNVIVMWIIVAHRRMRTVTNLFLLNLAIADFLLASGNATFNFIFMLNSHWPFGETFCVVSNFVANLTVSTSVFTILALSLDRYVAVAHPLRPRMTKTVAYSIILSVWTLSSLLSLPSLLYATTITYKYGDETQRTLCLLVWPDGLGTGLGTSDLDHIYNIVFLVVTYVIPMICMAFTYTWIGCILCGSKVIGESSGPQNNVIKSKQRVVHMLVAIMLLFAICWLPYHIYFLYTYYNSDVIHADFIQHVYLAIYWLAMSNSCYNPIVYYVMNSRFRGYFQDVMCLNRLSQKQSTTKTSKSQQIQVKTSIVTSNKSSTSRI
ncbi:hypothetical protein JTE90_029497 [Oedothorax gibbosus]|uniref:G-protein coupled receptors family 1 profile domain-containing protein n=1 Tax=Oedothorax gibbosus TaxID=931172 RepID=A0AAV6UG33_9ARAC|nr:hypothetical protein JTE90_029497 [Oedothorax gibbosus]